MSGAPVLNYNPEDESPGKVNARAIEATLSDAYNVVYLGAANLIPQAGAAYGNIGSVAAGYVGFAAAAVQNCFGSLRRRSRWIDGFLQFRLFYSGSASSTNPAQIRLRAAATKVGTDLTNPGGIGAGVNFAVPGPATLNFQAELDPATRLFVDQTTDTIHFRVERMGTLGTDTYAGTFYLLGVQITYQPNRRIG
jgi:hypothetical protein